MGLTGSKATYAPPDSFCQYCPYYQIDLELLALGGVILPNVSSMSYWRSQLLICSAWKKEKKWQYNKEDCRFELDCFWLDITIIHLYMNTEKMASSITTTLNITEMTVTVVVTVTTSSGKHYFRVTIF